MCATGYWLCSRIMCHSLDFMMHLGNKQLTQGNVCMFEGSLVLMRGVTTIDMKDQLNAQETSIAGSELIV